MTLVELLVVVGIMILLMAAALPLMKPALKDRKLRETSRQINAFFAGAKARAAERGRPVGVWIERSGESSMQGSGSFQLFIAEVPPPYTGDVQGATGTLLDMTPGAPPISTYGPDGIADVMELSFSTSPSAESLVSSGDFIKFDYKGPLYQIRAVRRVTVAMVTTIRICFAHPESIWNKGADGEWGAAGTDDDGNSLVDDFAEAGWCDTDDELVYSPAQPTPGISVPYQIFRAPRKSIAQPLVLPNGIAIDLNYSGFGPTVDGNGNQVADDGFYGRQFAATSTSDTTPVVIMFSPNGRVDRVYAGRMNPGPPPGTVHFLIGRIDQMTEFSEVSPLPYSTVDTTPIQFNANISDHKNLWLSINHRTGLISTTENGWPRKDDPANHEPYGMSFVMAREFAQSGQSMGGR